MVTQKPGRYALVHGEGSEDTVKSVARHAGVEVIQLGLLWTQQPPKNLREAMNLLRGRHVLLDIDVLFWPEVMVDPLRLFAALARKAPLLVAWPGSVANGRATYSEPGRPDHYDHELLPQAIVVRSRSTTFPDELPYEIERIS
jgi:hypothetical protein